MNASDAVAALGLPSSALLNLKVPKKTLVENAAITAADKRNINAGIEDVRWVASIKPATAGVAEFRDDAREYLEIHVLSVTLREGAREPRLIEVMHRAIPYPLILLLDAGTRAHFSLAHKRLSQAETGKTVLDDGVTGSWLDKTSDDAILKSFLQALPLPQQPRASLHTLYQGWMDTVLALQIAAVTGAFDVSSSAQHAAGRRRALAEYLQLAKETASLRRKAGKEKQLARRVEQNLQIKRLEAARAAARATL